MLFQLYIILANYYYQRLGACFDAKPFRVNMYPCCNVRSVEGKDREHSLPLRWVELKWLVSDTCAAVEEPASYRQGQAETLIFLSS